ncbi:39S ribosomal protein L41, mitochondrial [Anopheles merus]|nr:39S ribosomal protein L41, mitochondrial [Anopheles merus]
MFSFLHRSKHISTSVHLCTITHRRFSLCKMFHIIKRGISTTASLSGKKNFRKFLLYNKRGTRIFKQQRAANPDLYPDMPIDKRGVRDTGVTIDGNFVEIAEKIPELIVPNLEGCKFKPYVSYKAPDVVQSEFTSQDLFNSVYAQKIIDDWKSGKLNDDGSPMEPSAEEMQSAEEAWIKARKTGSDIF